MKYVIGISTHMIVTGTCMLLTAGAFDSAWELLTYSLGTMMLAAICYAIRQKEMSFWMFLGSHLLMIVGGIFVIPMVGLPGWYAAVLVILTLYSAILRLVPAARWLEEPGVIYVVFLAFVYLFVCFLDESITVQNVSLWAVVITFLLYMLYRNLESMDEFIMLESFSTKVDEQGIRKLNNRLSLLYTGVLGVVLGLFSLFRVDGLWQTVLEWFKKLIRFIVSLFPMAKQMQPEEEAEVEKGMTNLFQELAEEAEPSPFMQLIGEIFRVLMAILIVMAIIAGIIYAAIYIYRHFYHKKDREETNKVTETLSFGREIRRERKNRFFERSERNAARRIRKIYKKNMKRIGANRISGFACMSPEEQVQFLREQGTDEETIEVIKSLYEKARYSADLMTDAEVEHMQKIM